MVKPHPFEILSPLINLIVWEGDRVNALLFHQRMWCRICAADIELLFEKTVDEGIDVKSRPRGTTDVKSVIDIETPRTLQK